MPEEPRVTIEKLGHIYLITFKDGIENRVGLTTEELKKLKQLLNEMKL